MNHLRRRASKGWILFIWGKSGTHPNSAFPVELAWMSICPQPHLKHPIWPPGSVVKMTPPRVWSPQSLPPSFSAFHFWKVEVKIGVENKPHTFQVAAKIPSGRWVLVISLSLQWGWLLWSGLAAKFRETAYLWQNYSPIFHLRTYAVGSALCYKTQDG